MNHVLYNISVVIIFCGIILMVIYFTKKSNNNVPIRRQRPPLMEDIYKVRPSNIFKTMFSTGSTWDRYQEYQEYDGNTNKNIPL